jgi:hypothetical protein
MLSNLGATEVEIVELKKDSPVAGMSEEATLIMKACDEWTLKGCVEDETLKAMKAKWDEQMMIKYILVMRWYNMFNRFTVSTRVPVESEKDIDEKIGRSTLPAWWKLLGVALRLGLSAGASGIQIVRLCVSRYTKWFY